jgi:hypothetical protein
MIIRGAIVTIIDSAEERIVRSYHTSEGYVAEEVEPAQEPVCSRAEIEEEISQRLIAGLMVAAP